MLTAEEKTFASEQGHFYRPTGEPAYEVPYKDKKRAGEMRPTTIRDARERGLYPSVTTIMKVMGKGDALVNWAKKKVAETAWNMGVDTEWSSQDEYVERVLRCAEENMTRQRDIGTKDHGEVERYFSDLAYSQSHPDEVYIPKGVSRAVEAAISALNQLKVDVRHLDSEKSFACPLGYGGKIDISGDLWIVDMKFVDRLEKKKDYIDKIAQGSAYLYGKYGLDGLVAGRFANVFIETETYCFQVREWSSDEIKKGWKVFRSAFDLWKALHHDPLEVMRVANDKSEEANGYVGSTPAASTLLTP